MVLLVNEETGIQPATIEHQRKRDNDNDLFGRYENSLFLKYPSGTILCDWGDLLERGRTNKEE